MAPDRRAELQHALIVRTRRHRRAHAPRGGTRDDAASGALARDGLLRRTAVSRAGTVDLLNHDVTPWVPEHGSLGASGDLAPLALARAVLLGEGSGCSARTAPGSRRGGAARRRPGADRPRPRRRGLRSYDGTDGMLGMLLTRDRRRAAPVHHGRHHRRIGRRGHARIGSTIPARAAHDPAAPRPSRVGGEHAAAAAGIRPSWTPTGTT